MKKKLLISVLLFLFVGLVLVSWIFYVFFSRPRVQNPAAVFFNITRGETASSVLDRLHQAGLVNSPALLKTYVRLYGLTRKFQPGGYVLSTASSTAQTLNTLFTGPRDIWVTIPEGWRREQIAIRLSAHLKNFDPGEFISLTHDLEGQLFPDTYLFPSETSAADAIRIMTTNFQKKSGLALPRDQDILITASLIEREAKYDSDRTAIAGVLANRLRAGWPLQVDATVQYARDTNDFKFQISNFKFWEPIYNTKFPSAYNTYLNPGLPPAPVCNPGLSSLNAARNPATTPYWYYLTGNDGITRFATTLSEHNSNVDKYLLP